MSVRRWIGITGVVVAVAGTTAASGRVGSSEFEARVSLLLERTEHRDLLDARERLLDSPAVKDLVRARLGETPPVWATASADDTLLVRSRGATPEQAAMATETYAASYVDVRRRQIEVEASAAAEEVRRKTEQITSQLESADEPQRTALVELLGVFNRQLDMLQLDLYGPSVVGSTPGAPIHDWSHGALFVAAVGATVGAFAAVSAWRAGRRDHAAPPAP